MIVGLVLRLVFVHLFRVSIFVLFWFSLDYCVLVLFAFVALDLVFFECYAKRLAGKNVSIITYFVSSGTYDLNSINQPPEA